MEKLTNKVSVSLSSLDSEDEKCKSKPKVTFLLIILNFFVTAPMKKRTFQAHQNGEKYYLLLLLSVAINFLSRKFLKQVSRTTALWQQQ